ncbi:hypothetical protein [Janthinobacterium sp. LB3P118]|uniref:hypothetical protein n=1 Tax=Janthinobacterium sp. LB3P118 TaxID=3424195 RepID=UPI003F27BBF1
MPAPSLHFSNLRLAHDTLVSIYLPNIAAIGIPTPQEQEMTRAFVALAHAEIEFYFESICEEIVIATETEYKAGRITSVALGLITFSGLPILNGGDRLIPDKKGVLRKTSERFYSAAAIYRKTLADNHGIRQKYLGLLLTPLGLTQENVDPNWIVLMDAFAGKRGAIAHKSMFHIEAQSKNINPIDEALQVKRLLFDDPKLKVAGSISSIESFDAWAMHQIVTPNNKILQGHRRYNGFFKKMLWRIVQIAESY